MECTGPIRAKDGSFEARGHIDYKKTGQSLGEMQGEPGELMQVYAKKEAPNDTIETNIGEVILYSNIGDTGFRFELKGEPKGLLKKKIEK